MNIPATLAKCRAGLKRQQDMEAKATPAEWWSVGLCGNGAVHGPRVNGTDGIPMLCRFSSEWDGKLAALVRNLNPARLKVAEELLAEIVDMAVIGYPDEYPAYAESDIRHAAALLGVEVIQ